MTHGELSDLYELYALGALEPEEKAEIEEHLARGCEECKAGVRRALGFNTFLATAAEQCDPPKRLRKRVLASIGIEAKTWRLWTGVGVFASVCLAVLLMIVATEAKRRGDQLASVQAQLRNRATDLDQVQAALRLLDQPETRQVIFGQGGLQPPRGRVFVHSERGVLLMASNLPSTPSGRIYEMWLIPKTGAAKPAGLFQSDSQGEALHFLPGPVDPGTAAVAVTVEPEAGSQAPTSKPIIVAGLSD
jgi:anti-sigma-K factor RskA